MWHEFTKNDGGLEAFHSVNPLAMKMNVEGSVAISFPAHKLSVDKKQLKKTALRVCIIQGVKEMWTKDHSLEDMVKWC